MRVNKVRFNDAECFCYSDDARYGREANALHVALEASDAIVDEYEREVQVQEEVQADLRLHLTAMTTQDEEHESGAQEWRSRFIDMKRMYVLPWNTYGDSGRVECSSIVVKICRLALSCPPLPFAFE